MISASAQSAPSAPRAGSALARAATAVGTLAALATLLVALSLVPSYPLTLLEHFRLQLLAGCGAAVLLTAALRLALWFDLAVSQAVLALVLVTPSLSGERLAGPADGVLVRVLVANVLTSNPDVDRLAALIRDLSPDVIALLEPNQRWFDRLAPSLVDYPGRIEIPDAANFGIALYARGAVRGGGELLGSRQPTVVAEVELAPPSRAAPLSVVVTHPVPPVGEDAQRVQSRHLEAVAQRISELRQPLIVAGDLNATPWSRAFAELVHSTGLVDTRRGFGVHATFPAFPEVARLVRIPIDHVLVSRDIGVHDRRVERPIGSDHLPVLVELLVPAR